MNIRPKTRTDYRKIAFRTYLTRPECHLLDDLAANGTLPATQLAAAEKRMAMQLHSEGLIEIVEVPKQ